MNVKFKRDFLMNENSGGESSAGGGAGESVSNPLDSSAPATDDLGYAIEPDEKPDEAAKPADPAKPAVKKATGYEEEVPAADPAPGKSGYGEEPPAADPAKPAEAAKPADEPKLDYELDVNGIPEKDAKYVKDFAIKHKVPKEVAQALVEERREAAREYAAHQAKLVQQQKEQKIAWHKELKEDKDFGGANFAHNVKQAERVIEEFMPNIKNKLTESGAMLPPYIMRDLASLAKTLYGTKPMVQGDISTPDDESDDSHLDFYSKKES